VNAIVRLPAGITTTQSYTWVLREQFIVTLAPYFVGFTILRSNQVPIQRAQLPVLGVYLLPERMTPEENNPNANQGMITFKHNFQIGISVIIANNDPDIAEQKLDAAFWTVMNTLWPSQNLMRMTHSPNPDGVAIEGVVNGVRRMVYGAVGLNNETPVAELQYEVNCTYRSDWPPIITDTLDTIAVTVIEEGFSQDDTETIDVVYDFTESQAAYTGFYLGF
jgi:hypothetical protein